MNDYAAEKQALLAAIEASRTRVAVADAIARDKANSHVSASFTLWASLGLALIGLAAYPALAAVGAIGCIAAWAWKSTIRQASEDAEKTRRYEAIHVAQIEREIAGIDAADDDLPD